MEIAVRSVFFGLNSKLINQKQVMGVQIPYHVIQRVSFCLQKRDGFQGFTIRNNGRTSTAACALSSSLDLKDSDDASAAPFEDFSVASTTASEAGKIKIRVNVSVAKSQAIFEEVFSKMVDEAQPISGFRRVKGGKTPNIPSDILLQILGPSVVYKRVVKKIISSAIAEYVQKDNLKITKDLKVEQSFEKLVAAFKPGKEFSFDAVIELQEAAVTTL